MKIPAPTELMYDKQENSIFTPAVFNGDYVKKQKVDMTSHPVNNEIAAFETLEAYQLVEAYKKDELKGKLKEIAADLNEGSNTVIMVMKYKNKVTTQVIKINKTDFGGIHFCRQQQLLQSGLIQTDFLLF